MFWLIAVLHSVSFHSHHFVKWWTAELPLRERWTMSKLSHLGLLGVLIFSAAVTFWYLCAEQHSNGHSYVIKFGDVTPNDQGGRILGTMESIENLRHFEFRFWENCFEWRMPWVEYAVSVESSRFHFAFSIQILWDSWSSANKDPSQLKWKALLIFWFQF